MKHPKQYCVGVSSSIDCRGLPTVIKFEIDEPEAREIIRLSQMVTSNDLYKVEKFDWRATYLRRDPREAADESNNDEASNGNKRISEDSEIFMDAPTLNVSDDEFWFAASVSNANIEVVSARVAIRELVEHFGLAQSTESSTARQVH